MGQPTNKKLWKKELPIFLESNTFKTRKLYPRLSPTCEVWLTVRMKKKEL